MSGMSTTGNARIAWSDVPDHVREAVNAILGADVVESSSQAGGFSPGAADRVVTASGRRAFVKSVGAAHNPHTPDIHRREAAIAAQLPPGDHTPRLLGSFDDGDWVALVMEDVEGRHPLTPWDPVELGDVLRSLASLSASLTPTPIRDLPAAKIALAGAFAGWARIAADPPPDLDAWCTARLGSLVDAAQSGLAALDGDSVLHTDLRADNLLLRTDGTVVFVDWPWACVGPAWLDVLGLLVNVNLFGGHDMQALVGEYLKGVPNYAVTGALAGLTGYFIDVARQPPPLGLPTVRTFQRQQGEASLAWLKQRMP